MLTRIISGGQTGADQAGWRAAKRFGLETSGWMPRGYLTEDGPRPEFAELYGAKEGSSSRYPPRTRRNIRDSDLTMIFDAAQTDQIVGMSRGTQLAVSMARGYERLCLIVRVDLASESLPRRAESIKAWLDERNVRVINVAGNRESTTPGIGAWVEAYLCEMFAAMGQKETR